MLRQGIKIVVCLLVCCGLEYALKQWYEFTVHDYYRYAESIHEATHKHLLRCHTPLWSCQRCEARMDWSADLFQCAACNQTTEAEVPTFTDKKLRVMRHNAVVSFFQWSPLARGFDCHRRYDTWLCKNVVYPVLYKTLEYKHVEMHPVSALVLALAFTIALLGFSFVVSQCGSIKRERQEHRNHLESRAAIMHISSAVQHPPVMSPDNEPLAENDDDDLFKGLRARNAKHYHSEQAQMS